MTMWELRENRGNRNSYRDSYRGKNSYGAVAESYNTYANNDRYGEDEESYNNDYDCGYKDGYAAAMRESYRRR